MKNIKKIKNDIKKTKSDINIQFAATAYTPEAAHSLMNRLEANYYGLNKKKNEPDRRGLFVEIEQQLQRDGTLEQFGFAEDAGLGQEEYEAGEKGAVFKLLDKFKVEFGEDNNKQEGYFLEPRDGGKTVLAFPGNMGLASVAFLKMLPLALEKGYGLYCPDYRSFTVDKEAVEEEVSPPKRKDSKSVRGMDMLDELEEEEKEPEKKKVKFLEEPSAKNLAKDAERAAKFLEEQGIAHQDTVVYGMCLGTWPAISLVAKNSKEHKSKGVEEYLGLVVDSPMASSTQLVQEEVAKQVGEGKLTLPPLVTPGTVARLLGTKHKIRNKEYMPKVTIPVTVMLSPQDTIVPTPHHGAVYEALPEKNKNNGTAKLYKTKFKGHVAATLAETADEIEDIINGRDKEKYGQRKWMRRKKKLTEENAEKRLKKALDVYMEKYLKDVGEEQREYFQNLAEGAILNEVLGEEKTLINLPKNEKGFHPWVDGFYAILDELRSDVCVWQYTEKLKEHAADDFQGAYDALINRTFEARVQDKMHQRLRGGIEAVLARKLGRGVFDKQYSDVLVDKVAATILQDEELREAVGEITSRAPDKAIRDLTKQAIRKIDLEMKEKVQEAGAPKQDKEKEKGKEKLPMHGQAKNKGKEKMHNKKPGEKNASAEKAEEKKVGYKAQIKRACEKAVAEAGLNLKKKEVRGQIKALEASVAAEYKAQRAGKEPSGTRVFSQNHKRLKGWREKIDTIAAEQLEQRQQEQLAQVMSVRQPEIGSDEDGNTKRSREIREITIKVKEAVSVAMEKEPLELSDNTREVVKAELTERVKEKLQRHQMGESMEIPGRVSKVTPEAVVTGFAQEAWQERKVAIIARKSQSAALPVIKRDGAEERKSFSQSTAEDHAKRRGRPLSRHEIEHALQPKAAPGKGKEKEKEKEQEQLPGSIDDMPTAKPVVGTGVSTIVEQLKKAGGLQGELVGSRAVPQASDDRYKGKEKEPEKEREEFRPSAPPPAAASQKLSSILEQLNQKGLDGTLGRSTLSRTVYKREERAVAQHPQNPQEKQNWQQRTAILPVNKGNNPGRGLN